MTIPDISQDGIMGEDVPLVEHIPELRQPGSETYYISINVSPNPYTHLITTLETIRSLYRSRRLMGVLMYGRLIGIAGNISSNAYVLISCLKYCFFLTP